MTCVNQTLTLRPRFISLSLFHSSSITRTYVYIIMTCVIQPMSLRFNTSLVPMPLKCCNPSLGLVTKAWACKGAVQKRSPRVTSHVLESVGECEGMNPHIPKWWRKCKACACKGVVQERSPRVTSHDPGSVGECEGMNPHTPKWAPTLGVGVSNL
jgi:hypothetical protein